MARFRYRLQTALDDALARERIGGVALAEACRTLTAQQAASSRLSEHAVRTRAELPRGGSATGGLYVEVGLRLRAIAGARVERATRVAEATQAVARARHALAGLAERRGALERHCELARERFMTSEARREAAECDESNVSRRAGSLCRSPMTEPA